jgi:pectate lyase
MATLTLRLVNAAAGLVLLVFLVVLAPACGAPGFTSGFTPNPNQRDGTTISSDVVVYTDAPVGWASVSDLGVDGTTGGGALSPTVVTTFAALSAAVAGTTPAVVQLAASVSGVSLKVGSNKTLLGMPGVVFQGHMGFGGAVNVIMRNMTVVGNNCLDNPDCQSGADAVTIDNRAHHVWIDHCDVSDGSDGNLDIVGQADYVTISWTKFWYSGPRPGGHQFSNLIGSSDQDVNDTGHLRVTWHHNWWADRVGERMPRARFGLIHLFDNLYTAVGDASCVGLGVAANMLMEDEVFKGVAKPIDVTHSNAASIVTSFANLYEDGTVPSADRGSGVFTPPYAYTVQSADEVEATVTANVGPQAQ